MNKKVLIYEGMPGHGECLSSYYAYFKELGYDIDFVIRENVANEKPLWMLNDVKIYSITSTSNARYARMLPHLNEIKQKVPDLFEYDLYFIGTFNQDGYNFVRFLSEHGIGKNKILFQHHLNYKTFLKQSMNDITLGQNGFTLGMADHDHFPQLAASINITKKSHKKQNKNLNKITIFFAGLSHIHFKNFELFVKAVDELNRDGKDIKVNVCGIREQKNYVLPVSPNINYLGRISFEESIEHYCNDDFIFVLFDEKALDCLDEHHMFLDGRISGSRNMSIMYKIPLVVQKPYQQSWGFDDTNSIGYEGHDYKKVLLDLCDVNKIKYNSIIDNLCIKEKEEFKLCVNNLKNKIEFLKTNTYNNTIGSNFISSRSITKINHRKKRDFIHY